MGNISLIITTFNRPQLLPAAVDSALRAGKNIEVIVVDDASKDETADVCRSMKGIRYVRAARNQGVAGARNIGLLASTGKYIAFLDDDDLRLPGSADHQAELLDAAPEAGFLASAFLPVDQNYIPTGEVYGSNQQGGDVFWNVLELGMTLLPGSVLVRKSCFSEVGLFNRDIPGIDDWDMFARIAEVRPIIVDDVPVSIYRTATPQSGQGSSCLHRHLGAALRHQRELFKLSRVSQSPARFRRQARSGIRRRISDTLSSQAASQLPLGAIRFSASSFLTALCICPWWALRPAHLGTLYSAVLKQASNRKTGSSNAVATLKESTH